MVFNLRLIGVVILMLAGCQAQRQDAVSMDSFDIGDPSASQLKGSELVVGQLQDGRFAYFPPANVHLNTESFAVNSVDELAARLKLFENIRIVNVPGGDYLRRVPDGEFLRLRELVLAKGR